VSTKAPSSMRYEWRRLVVRDAYLTDSTRRVLLELESYANPDGTKAHPGIARIAAALRTTTQAGTVNEKTVRRALAEGVRRGLIECTYKSRGGRAGDDADEYRLTLPAQEAGSDDGVEAEDADPFDSGKHESATHSHRAPRNAETVDTQMPGVLPETVDIQMSTDQTTAADIPSTNGGHLTPNGGHPDAHAPEPLHQISYQEGAPEVTNSLVEPVHSDNAPTQPPPPSADDWPPMPAAEHGLSRYCEKHPGGTPNSCPACGAARRAVEEAEAAIKRAEKQRITADEEARRAAAWRAVEACSMCDEDGYRNRRICNHRPEQDRVNAEGKAKVLAAIAAARRKREEEGQRIRVDTAGRPIRGAAKSGPRQSVRGFRSGDDAGQAVSRAELERPKLAPLSTRHAPDGEVEADRALQASVA